MSPNLNSNIHMMCFKTFKTIKRINLELNQQNCRKLKKT